jgi:hypothetical protein
MKFALTARFEPQMILAIADISYRVFSPLGHERCFERREATSA